MPEFHGLTYPDTVKTAAKDKTIMAALLAQLKKEDELQFLELLTKGGKLLDDPQTHYGGPCELRAFPSIAEKAHTLASISRWSTTHWKARHRLAAQQCLTCVEDIALTQVYESKSFLDSKYHYGNVKKSIKVAPALVKEMNVKASEAVEFFTLMRMDRLKEPEKLADKLAKKSKSPFKKLRALVKKVF